MCKAESQLWFSFGADVIHEHLENQQVARIHPRPGEHLCSPLPQTPGSGWYSRDSTGKSLLWAYLLFRGWKTPHSCSSEAGLIDWSHMNLKAVKSKEDEKQFKLLYYHFLVKYQFSPQPYCEAAGFQISTVLACAPRREEMPGSEKQKHLLRPPAGLLLEPWWGRSPPGGVTVSRRWQSTPVGGFQVVGGALLSHLLKTSFT